ncbi:MAG: hypothetical protein NW215_02460 [Hyphomicrobiales bacterium]|nr:hypothetical protein [Hyphomicrobiales bacterium]
MKPAIYLAALTFAALASDAALAGFRARDRFVDEVYGPRAARKLPDGYRYVIVESHNGHRTVVAPVRPARLGPQVKLPGGAWVYCEITCEYTVRRLSLDFWEGQGQGFTSPGYFRKHFHLD